VTTSAALLQRFLADDPVILDGATGTELERRGFVTRLPLWSAAALTDAPDLVETIHREYVAAGARLLVANTFRTNVRTLRAAGRLDDGPALNHQAVELARRAAATADDVLVAASVAPVEDCYHPERTPGADTLRAEHEQMMTWLRAAAPDLVWIETMGTIREARIAAAAAAEAGLPLAVSFITRADGTLLGGEPLADAVDAVEPCDPVAIGLNCVPPTGLTANLARLRPLTSRPLATYAHINNPVPTPGWTFAEFASPDEYARHARDWRALGARLIGGCCGTTPAHIAALRQVATDPADEAAI
jgi:homocysteine S-methyltransferase